MIHNTYTYEQFRYDQREQVSRAEKERIAREAREQRDNRKRKPDND